GYGRRDEADGHEAHVGVSRGSPAGCPGPYLDPHDRSFGHGNQPPDRISGEPQGVAQAAADDMEHTADSPESSGQTDSFGPDQDDLLTDRSDGEAPAEPQGNGRARLPEPPNVKGLTS